MGRHRSVVRTCAINDCEKVIRQENVSGYCTIHYRLFLKTEEGRRKHAKACKKCYANKSRPRKTKDGRRMGLKRKFDITLEQYELAYDFQGGVCAICGFPESAKTQYGNSKMLAVDHDHETGELRGLLCNKCNFGLSSFRDDVKILRKAIGYLVGINRHTRNPLRKISAKKLLRHNECR